MPTTAPTGPPNRPTRPPASVPSPVPSGPWSSRLMIETLPSASRRSTSVPHTLRLPSACSSCSAWRPSYAFFSSSNTTTANVLMTSPRIVLGPRLRREGTSDAVEVLCRGRRNDRPWAPREPRCRHAAERAPAVAPWRSVARRGPGFRHACPSQEVGPMMRHAPPATGGDRRARARARRARAPDRPGDHRPPARRPDPRAPRAVARCRLARARAPWRVAGPGTRGRRPAGGGHGGAALLRRARARARPRRRAIAGARRRELRLLRAHRPAPRAAPRAPRALLQPALRWREGRAVPCARRGPRPWDRAGRADAW